MAVAKINLNGNTWIDLTNDTVAANNLATGKTAHGADGEAIVGEVESGNNFTLDQIGMKTFNFSSNDEIVLENATYLFPYSFYNQGFKSFSAPNVTQFKTTTNNVGSHIFYHCANLINLNLPKATDMGSGGYQFANCTSLPVIHLPNSGGQHCCENCTSLVTAVLTGTGTMNTYEFQNDSALTTVDLSVSQMKTSEFKGCTNLTTLILRRTSSIVTMTIAPFASTGPFVNTPFKEGGTGGTIYVPQALLDTYPTSTNWSTIEALGTITWKPIEGSIYETQYADGTSILT